MSRPLIGLTCETTPCVEKRGAFDLLCSPRYAEAVYAAGGRPVLLPILAPSSAKAALEGLDGLLFVGGEDLPPAMYGQKPHPKTQMARQERIDFEGELWKHAKRARLPVLAVCLGMQQINVREGGSLVQHLGTGGRPTKVDHRGKKGPMHPVRILPGTRLASLLGAGTVQVPTSHHQGVDRLGKGFVPAAVAEDGLVEAYEHPDRPELLAVQWHPERAPGSAATTRLFGAFLQASKRR